MQSRELNDAKSNKTFEFILVDDSNPERKKKNRSIAHSHVKKTDKRTKREQQNQSNEPVRKSVVVVVEEEIGEDDFEELWSNHARSVRASSIDSLNLRRPSFSSDDLLTDPDGTNGWVSTISSMSLTIGLGFSTTLGGFFGAQDPRTRQMLDHCRTFPFRPAGFNIVLANDM